MEMLNQFASRYEQQTAHRVSINQNFEQEVIVTDFQKFNSAGMISWESHVQDVEQEKHTNWKKKSDLLKKLKNKRVRFEDEHFFNRLLILWLKA